MNSTYYYLLWSSITPTSNYRYWHLSSWYSAATFPTCQYYCYYSVPISCSLLLTRSYACSFPKSPSLFVGCWIYGPVHVVVMIDIAVGSIVLIVAAMFWLFGSAIRSVCLFVRIVVLIAWTSVLIYHLFHSLLSVYFVGLAHSIDHSSLHSVSITIGIHSIITVHSVVIK